MKRNLRVDVCDYNNTILCNLYDNYNKVSGAAHDVYVTTERNGNKELIFSIPTKLHTEEGEEENYRLQFLRADYRLRTLDDDEEDYYLISEPKITHNAYSKNVDVRASHISMNLKNKAIDLEFSDEEGNNTGTADALLDTILEGTGWTRGYVEVFTEDDGSIKKRSLTSSAGTGALGLIQSLCELFEASPVYHGGTRTVDLVSMNPFSKVENGEVPQEVLNGRNVIELHYDRNIKNLTKTVNTENIITRLYAYGAYGSEVTGYCSIQTCEHDEYIFTAPDATAGSWFEFVDDMGAEYFFSPTEDLVAGQRLIWSRMDFASRSYVWNENTRKAYKVVKEPESAYQPIVAEIVSVINRFPYLMNFDYYDEVGLLTDDMLQEVAHFQRTVADCYRISEEAGQALANAEWELSQVGESNAGFAKLNVLEYTTATFDGDSGYVKIILKQSYIKGEKTIETPDGVIYRSDYDEAEKNYFQWHVAKKFKPNGDSYDNVGSVVYVIHPDGTWDKAYITGIYDSNDNLYTNTEGEPTYYSYGKYDDYPSAVRVNAKGWSHLSEDKVFLFCANSMSGSLGAKQVEDEAVVENLTTQTKEETEEHPVYFISTDEVLPSTSAIQSSYGWCYQYSRTLYEPGTLYFCWGVRGEQTWTKVYVQETEPVSFTGNPYFFNTKYKTLWRYASDDWYQYESSAEQRLANMFSKVYYYCRKRDMLYKGLYENYTKNVSSLAPGNYAFDTKFAFFWAFTTDVTTTKLKLDTTTGYVYQNDDTSNIITASVYPFDTVYYPAENDLGSFSIGSLDTNGVEIDAEDKIRSNNIRVYENTTYEYRLPTGSRLYTYDINLEFIQSYNVGGDGTVTLASKEVNKGNVKTFIYPRYARLLCSRTANTGGGYITPEEEMVGKHLRVQDYADKIYINDKMYTVLRNAEGSGDLNGINDLTVRFGVLADEAYDTYLPQVKDAQQAIKDENELLTNTLGEVLRENKWEDSSFVQGDEQRLYTKAMENLEELAQPDITYSFDFLDMYGSNHNMHYYEEHDVEWPDIKITDAAHLADPELKESKWAYIDKINKCYDQEWLTSIEINTKLSLVGQHEFTDVLSRIAEVAKSVKGKQNIYDRAALLNKDSIPSDLLEGTINLNQTLLKSGASNYHTDSNGNIVFESADGLTAMILGGRGLGVSNQKTEDGDWLYRSALTGSGLTADIITTGYMSADRIEAGSITANKLSSNVGQELEIGSNKALLLYATVNGSRPAGTVKTTDAYIEIKAGQGSTKAQINVESGGELNMKGSSVNITSTGKLDLVSGGEFHLRSNGADSISSTANGLYIGNDGINIGNGKFKAAVSGSGATVEAKAQSIYFGDLTYKIGNTTYKYPIEAVLNGAALKIDSINGTMSLLANNTIDIAAGKNLTLVSQKGSVIIGNAGKAFTVGSNGTNAYIYNGPSSIGAATDGAYYGTDGLYIRGTKSNVTSYIKATAAGDVDISGKITATSGTIGGINANSSYGLYTGSKTTATSTATGFLIHKDGAIYLGAYDSSLGSCPFQVTSAGALTAKNATITGTISGSTISGGTISGTTITGGSINISSGKFTVDASGNLTVTSGADITGKITASSGKIGPWNITDKLIYAKPQSNTYATYIAIDGSTDKYPLSGLSTPADHYYAIWAGAEKPQDAPFSVTKDGIVTIKSLRIKKSSSGDYDTMDLSNFAYTVTTGEDPDFDVSTAFGKLKFQTIKSIKVDSTTGQVKIYITNSSGTSTPVGFDSAAAVNINSLACTSGEVAEKNETRTSGTIQAATAYGKTKSADFELVKTTYMVDITSPTQTYKCVNLKFGGSRIGRIDVQDIYQEGYDAGSAGGHSSDHSNGAWSLTFISAPDKTTESGTEMFYYYQGTRYSAGVGYWYKRNSYMATRTVYT